MSLVDVGWLSAHLTDPSVRVCDVRWYLKSSGKSGAAEYAKGHVAGAVFVDLDAWLAGPDDGRAGRHPLPEPESFARGLAAAGIGPGTHVVAYDDAGGAMAARLWWMLRAVGHAHVSLLDGGYPAWLSNGGATTTEEPAVVPAPVRPVSFPAAFTVGHESLQASLRAGSVTLLDARAPERYRGEVEPVDPRAGHVPGALNVPTGSLLDGGRFLPTHALAAKFEAAGVTPSSSVVASCGSGVTACHLLFALDHAGVRPFGAARLYVGSFSEWSRNPALPVATGAAPGVLS